MIFLLLQSTCWPDRAVGEKGGNSGCEDRRRDWVDAVDVYISYIERESMIVRTDEPLGDMSGVGVVVAL